jgi:heme/copper-type cytochrome/quinol oxidase subunit 2
MQYVKTNASGIWYISSGAGTTSSNSTNGKGGWVLMPNTDAVRADVASHLDNIARQPITLTGFALLPVFAALLVGFVLYRASRARNETEEPPEAT